MGANKLLQMLAKAADVLQLDGAEAVRVSVQLQNQPQDSFPTMKQSLELTCIPC